ncbi:fused PTS fructose transporter subunit IIA/HPr protein [Photobacterium andalusiense]|uniref:Multiphosphoryl transfer protein n=1 Tax=Photobacterium andalusiense TaxID=2204296 RepID=A0A1Y6M8D4_9GAMM|nr:fused PTS fructose transporter subunit IIA/HPr protein [Photobacterium andalusiense]SMY32782.1 Multiphosphoryl transfer protein [Photobacterium andalusiense]
MLSLSKNDITMQQIASTKQDAIKALAADLEATGLVQTGYVNGMLAREQQNSTYLGNGIAIPHGTTDTRDLVNHTGVKIHHFPQGVPWGNDQTAYIAIGIAAKSDEHLGILNQLTKVLSADGIEDKLRHCESEQAIIALLNGDEQQEAECNPELILKQFPAQDLLQLTAVAAGLIKYQGFAETATVTDAIDQGASYLGQGLWLVKSNKQVKRTAISVVTPQTPFEELGYPVAGMIMIAANNNAHKANLEHLTNLIYQGKISQWLASSAPEMVTALTQVTLEGNQATFTIRNPHGLHARPGAMLVNTTKKFDADIQVVNLTSSSKPVNAKSLMKVIGLGVKCGNELQFTAQGSDAEAALTAIGQAIADGLGEKL